MKDLSGSVVDRYRLIRRIGAGGMGAVYEAEHTLIGRRCAVKLLHARYAQDAELAKRMLREARAAAAIGHPNIVETIDFGVTPDGARYLVMEFLKGATLTLLLKARGRLEAELAAGILWQVLGALEAAHAKGIIHRDLKPDNVFLARTPLAGDVVKLLDFGISKVIAAESESARLTGTGTVLGTPHYMSPEQAAGARGADARSDIWSVGVMLYELLTGRLPFPGANYNQIILSIVTRPVTPPRALRPDLSPSLESVVMCALDKEPARRFQSAGDMRAALRGHTGSTCDATGRLRLPPELLDGLLAPTHAAPGTRAAPATSAAPTTPSAPAAPASLAPSPAPAPAEPAPAPVPSAPASLAPSPAPAPAEPAPAPVPSAPASLAPSPAPASAEPAPAPVPSAPSALAPSPAPAPAPAPGAPGGRAGRPPGDSISTQPRGQVSVRQEITQMIFSRRGRGIKLGIGIGAGVLLLGGGDHGDRPLRPRR